MISGLGAAAVAEFDHVLCNQAREVRKRSVFVSVCIVWISIYMCIFGMTKQIAIALHKRLLLRTLTCKHSNNVVLFVHWIEQGAFWLYSGLFFRMLNVTTIFKHIEHRGSCQPNTIVAQIHSNQRPVCMYMYWTAAAASHAHNASHRNAYVFFLCGCLCLSLSRILFFMRLRLFVVCGYLWYLSLYRASLHIVYKARQQQQNELTKYRLMLLRVRWVLAQWATQSVVFSVSGRTPIYYSIRQKKEQQQQQ